MIEIAGLTKRYGAVTAVDDLTFAVGPGLVTGFLGPNGAGKSTTMRMLLGLGRPTSGRALVHGRPYPELPDPLRWVGALVDARSVHKGRTVASHLLWLARTNGIGRRRVAEVLELVGLAGVGRRRAGALSLGTWRNDSAWPPRCWAIRPCWCWTSRSTAWTPRACGGCAR
ncbi:ABC transporter [Streptoalloteichus hindustanus]|uniref:ABC transporter n=1 Tax=Streptoalloteichus hindustanus TaxID=2017 RepID=A0A1M5D2M0_STRHI|nr:ABC transporter [Streptoalloteichus hindustanus]